MSHDSRVSLHPSFILHSRPYRDTSRLLDVFTRDYGRITLVAKGARSARSKIQGVLEVFSPLLISWSGKGEVQTLTGAESLQNNIHLSGKQIMSGYYLNEILQRLVTVHDPHPEIFDYYSKTLEHLGKDDEETILRNFEKTLLSEIGYGLNLTSEVESGEAVTAEKEYLFDIEKGPVEMQLNPEQGNINNEINMENYIRLSGKTLLDLDRGIFSTLESKKQAKQLMRIILAHYLGEKPLRTRDSLWYKPL